MLSCTLASEGIIQHENHGYEIPLALQIGISSIPPCLVAFPSQKTVKQKTPWNGR